MSEKSNSSNTPFSGFNLESMMSDYSSFPKSAQHFIKIQNNNLSAMKEIQSVMFANMQEISQRQSAVFSRIMEQTTLITNDMSKTGRPEEKLIENINVIKENYNDAMTSVKDISALVRKANERATKILKESAEQNYKESQSVFSTVAAQK